MSVPNDTYVALPPDGAGKKLSARTIRYLPYRNQVQEFFVGDRVFGQLSGKGGTIGHIHVSSPTTGVIVVVPNVLEQGHHDMVFADGEALLVDGVQKAEADGTGNDVFVQRSLLAGGNNPINTQHVDAKGAASIKFSEGSAQFDSFGRIQTVGITTLGTYTHTYDDRSNKYTDFYNGSGTITYEAQTHAVVFSVGVDSDAFARRVTNVYHKNSVGSSQYIKMTVASSDAGKMGVTRRWGYYDESDGLFFELDDTVLSVVRRSSVSGTIEEERIPQSSWNTDRLDGSGLSQVVIDPSKSNLYWIDFAWLGAGRARFGIFAPNGDRVTCHAFENANRLPYTYIKTGSLPLTWEIKNSGSSGSTSEFRLFNAVVSTESENLAIRPDTFTFSGTGSASAVTDTVYEPLLAIRPKQLFAGAPNRVIVMPKHLTIDASASGQDAKVSIQIREDPTLTAPNWQPFSEDSATEIDTVSTGCTGGKVIFEVFIDGTHNIDLEPIFNLLGEFLITRPDGTARTYSVCARSIRSEVTALVQSSLTWNEVRD